MGTEVTDTTDFAAFRSAIQRNPLFLQKGVLRYTGLGDTGTLTFYTDSTHLPEIDGKPIDFRPRKVYDSPFIQSEHDSGIVTLQKGTRRVVLDFNER